MQFNAWKFNIKKIIAIAAIAAGLAFNTQTAQAIPPPTTFEMGDIKYFTGSGTNTSAFVITWNDGKTPDSLVWGYKWDAPTDGGDAPTVLDMLKAIDAADFRLQITPHPNFTTPSFWGVFSIYFDNNGNGLGAPIVGTPDDVGGPGAENGFSPDEGDHYAEGWFEHGFWSEFVGIGNPYDGGSWTNEFPTASGVGTDALSDDGWYGLSFSTDLVDFTATAPGVPFAVEAIPEPSTTWLLASGAFGSWGLLVWRRRSRV